jgi:NAD(P)-dependent dehydrogenase (short-subunit alcohol dehydrogenase family)
MNGHIITNRRSRRNRPPHGKSLGGKWSNSLHHWPPKRPFRKRREGSGELPLTATIFHGPEREDKPTPALRLTIQKVYGKLIPIQGDVTSKDDLHRITATITSTTGFIDLLLANAGIPEPTPPSFPPSISITETQSQLWKTWDPTTFTNTLDVNVSGTFLSVLGFLPLLAAGNEAANVPQRSQVITTSSICGFNRRAPSGFAYAASKAAVTHMTKQLATALAPHGIRCNVLAPGGGFSLYKTPRSLPLPCENGVPWLVIPVNW